MSRTDWAFIASRQLGDSRRRSRRSTGKPYRPTNRPVDWNTYRLDGMVSA